MAEQYARITGWGMYVPERILTNHDLEQMVDTNDEWIVSRTGIRERRIVGEGETTVSMSLAAGQEALDKAGLRAADLDLIIVATSTPDYLCPSASSILQHRLGAKNAAAFDLVAGCTGFVYGLVTANQFIQSGFYQRVLVVGAETVSMGVDWTDRNTCVLFGDGAGAVVMQASSSRTGILASELGSDGSGWDAMVLPGGGSANPFSQKVLDNGENFLRMDGRRVFRFATRIMSESVRRVVSESGVSWDDIKLVIPHQANARIIDFAVRRMRLDPDKVMVNLDRYGNTSAASIALALYEAVEQGRLQPGDHVVLVGFGAGLTWATVVLHWEPTGPEGIAVLNWPVRERLAQQMARVRTAAWNARVALSTRAGEAATALLLPFYTWTGRRRKKRKNRAKTTDGG
ncbi:MAG TPA: beta-ketoacyl-ACP synthase III [Anaerolineae bacterium]|nr:beta-ketoacyl-ACP synthase III [Anaerolineae bacterium]